MTHRAQQIVEAAAAAISAETDLAASTFVNRELSLSDESQEIPAVVVNEGADSVLSELGVANLAFVDSLLELRVTAYAKASSEEALAEELARLRSVVHRALLATPTKRTLGLSFVMGVRYGGAEAATKDTTLDQIAGFKDLRFLVDYRMNIADPET